MEFFIAPSVGVGDGILARPAIELKVTEELEKFDLQGSFKATDGGRWGATAKVTYNAGDQYRVTAEVLETPGETPNYNQETTVRIGGEVDIADVTLTADFSPDAFGAGRTSRFGVKTDYQITERISAGGHARIRYQSDKNNWRSQSNAYVKYQLAENRDISLNFIQHDFFDDATTIKYTWKAFSR